MIRTTSIALFLLLAALPAGADSPWELLAEIRDGLREGGPMTGRFVQTYVPAGFDSGETERGHLSLSLPRCLRWNYEEPEAKSFLLCGDEVWFWNDLEPGGRHFRIDPEREPGLDLLLVPVDRLRERYSASSHRLDDGSWEIALATPGTHDGAFSARIRVDSAKRHVRGLEYTDEEGNRTRFEISDYQPLSHTALFRPPDLEWTEE